MKVLNQESLASVNGAGEQSNRVEDPNIGCQVADWFE